MQKYFPPVKYEEAVKRAESILNNFSLDEKIELIGGYSHFFIKSFPQHGIPYLFMADATQGIRITEIPDKTIVKELEKTTAFPSPILLASTWNLELVQEYAKAVGEEARAAGASFLLGPGINIYRVSQCGRNFEYFGEDPYLTSRITENYIIALQSTGTAATVKHFICNNTDFYRRRSNSIVDERTLHEIYLPGFKAAVEAGVMAVMTSYNKLNGEWCGEGEYVINNLLRKVLGFKWLVMTDWTSVWDPVKVIKSGQDLEMPGHEVLIDVKSLLNEGKVTENDINRMAKSILKTCIAMGFYDKQQQNMDYISKFPEHEETALKTSREGIVLLKNDRKILPLKKNIKITAVGKYIYELAHGGGAAYVKGYNNITLADALKNEFDNIEFAEENEEEKISSSDIVLLSIGTYDYEGADRPFDLPEDEEKIIQKILNLNSNTVVMVNSGAGINMSRWIDKAAAVVYAWYGGQTGNRALAEILSGKINPSGKLPITIEKDFKDSPGYGYMPADENFYEGDPEDKFTHREYDIKYKEGIFVGYRWYEHKKIKPLFPFGYGLSYTDFEYKNLNISHKTFNDNDTLEVSFKIKNVGKVDGAEIAQLYIQDIESSHPRPVKELKGFKKVFLKSGEEKEVKILLKIADFSYWNPDLKNWYAEPGEFNIMIGSSSENILLKEKVLLKNK